MFERGQHVYTNDAGAEKAGQTNPRPATYLREEASDFGLVLFGSVMYDISFGHIEVTEDTEGEGLAYPDEVFATREEAEAAL